MNSSGKKPDLRGGSKILKSELKQRLLTLLLWVAVMAAYWPALHGDFIWDDNDHISTNQALKSLGGLRAIWYQPGATMQYYPLTFSAWWLAYHLWGLDPLGYHLPTLLMHFCVAWLFWQLLVRLN